MSEVHVLFVSRLTFALRLTPEIALKFDPLRTNQNLIHSQFTIPYNHATGLMDTIMELFQLTGLHRDRLLPQLAYILEMEEESRTETGQGRSRE